MENNCGNCIFWGVEYEGVCDRIKDNTCRENKDTTYIDAFSEDCSGSLNTASDFYCNLFKRNI